MIFVLTFLNFAFGTHSKDICLDSRHLVLGLRVQSTSVKKKKKSAAQLGVTSSGTGITTFTNT